MDHVEATRLNAAEQYLLGELTGDLRDQFEEHFMSCPECARDIKAGVIFVESAREVLGSEIREATPGKASPSRSSGWVAALFRPAIAMPAMAILLAVIGYQAGVTIPRLESSLSKANSPRTLASFSLISENSRGGGQAAFAVRPDQPFSLYVDVPPEPSFSMYTLDVESENGSVRFAVPISAEEAKSTVQVLVPASRLSPGQYAMVIRGSSEPNNAKGAEVARYRFSLTYDQPTKSPNQ